jgi:hypothetical protein
MTVPSHDWTLGCESCHAQDKADRDRYREVLEAIRAGIFSGNQAAVVAAEVLEADDALCGGRDDAAGF